MNQYYLTKMFCCKKYVFIESGRLLFSLFIINQYCTTKGSATQNVCSKQMGCSSLIKCLMCIQSKWEAAKMFLLRIYKTFLKECFFVYLANYIKFCERLLFISHQYKTSINNCFWFPSVLINLSLWNFSFGSSELRFQFWS